MVEKKPEERKEEDAKKQKELTNKTREAKGTIQQIGHVLSNLEQALNVTEQVLPLSEVPVPQDRREEFLRTSLLNAVARISRFTQQLEKETGGVADAYRNCCGYGQTTEAVILVGEPDWNAFKKTGRIFIHTTRKTELLPGDKIEVRFSVKPENSPSGRVISFKWVTGSPGEADIGIERIP